MTGTKPNLSTQFADLLLSGVAFISLPAAANVQDYDPNPA